MGDTGKCAQCGNQLGNGAEKGRCHYPTIILAAVATGLSQTFIAATMVAVLMYSLSTKFKDIHIPLCTFGFHFFCIEDILGLYRLKGFSSGCRPKYRKWTHGFLQLVGLSLFIGGTVVAILDYGLLQPHGIIGAITLGLALLTLSIGPLLFFDIPNVHQAHMITALPTFILSSVTFALGMFKEAFKSWAGHEITIMLITFVAFYTLCIVILVIAKVVMAFACHCGDEKGDDDCCSS